MAFCPAAAASILVYRRGGPEAVARLLRRAGDAGRVGSFGWLVPTVLLMPCMAVLQYGFMLEMDWPLPPVRMAWAGVPVLLAGFFVGALGEELGWSGYAIGPLQDRVGALAAALFLGSVWAVWHIVPFHQAGRSPAWIAWQALNLVALRVLLVWLYNNTGRSVAAVALCHASSNLTWQMFPNQGSHFDPRIAAAITASVAVFVVWVWGPRTLSRVHVGQGRTPSEQPPST
jgi:hypothetical protein